MSRTLLTTADVPKYIREIVQRLRPDNTNQGGIWGYNWQLYGKHKIGYPDQLAADCEKLLAWCQRYYAEAKMVEERYWWDQAPIPANAYRGDRCHRRAAYRAGVRNYVIVAITDPVAHRFEKDGFYRAGGHCNDKRICMIKDGFHAVADIRRYHG